jgi:hypothetical protein
VNMGGKYTGSASHPVVRTGMNLTVSYVLCAAII